MDEDTRPRALLAYIMMMLFIISTTVGFFILAVWAGFVAFGIACGIYGYILGAN